MENLPEYVQILVRENSWQERYSEVLGRIVTFHRFVDFVTADIPDGLGTDVATIRKLLRGNPAALEALDEAIQSKPGNPTGTNQYSGIVDNVHNSTDRESPTGNTTDAALRRLRKDAPALHSRVLTGELSPHAAMIEAGFRKRTITIKVDPQSAAQTIARHFDRDQVSELIACLYDEIAGRRP